jgi:hypothetical protein
VFSSSATKPHGESVYYPISFLARNEVHEYYLLLIARAFGAEMLLGVDGLCPQSKSLQHDGSRSLRCGFPTARMTELF